MQLTSVDVYCHDQRSNLTKPWMQSAASIVFESLLSFLPTHRTQRPPVYFNHAFGTLEPVRDFRRPLPEFQTSLTWSFDIHVLALTSEDYPSQTGHLEVSNVSSKITHKPQTHLPKPRLGYLRHSQWPTSRLSCTMSSLLPSRDCRKLTSWQRARPEAIL